MELRCEWCREPAVPTPGEPLYCARCQEWGAEYQRNWDEVKLSGGHWNPSQHDPWWRHWLTSRELFDWYHDSFPRLGERTRIIATGEVFEYSRDGGNPVLAWISPSEVIVAYAHMLERHATGPHGEVQEFAAWVYHLRCSESLPLGRLQGRSSYGAICTDGSPTPPMVKWAQAGDWAALARQLRAAES